MFKMAVGTTEETDGARAAAELLAQCAESLGGQPPQAGLLLAGHDLDLEPALAAIMAAHPDLELIGCTTIAPLVSVSEYVEGSTALTLFSSDVVDFSAGIGSAEGGIDAAVRDAMTAALEKTDKDPALVITTPTVEGLEPAAVADEIARLIGSRVPVVGGGAVPDFPLEFPWGGASQFYRDRVSKDSVPILIVSGPLRVSVGVAHGWNPVGRKAVVTRSKINKVYEIDGRPVIDFYRHYLGSTSEPAPAHPLAILDEETGRYFLRAPTVWDEEEGAASFFGPVPEGSTVQIAMATTEQILDGADQSVREAVSGFPADATAGGALIAACAIRNVLLGTRSNSEIERIRAALSRPDLPIAGFYAFGEIAPFAGTETPRFHNETCVTVLIGT